MVIHTLITKFGNHLVQWFGEVAEFIVAFDFVLLELGTVALLFGLYFRYLPDIRLKWRDIWLGAVLTAGLLVLGKSLIGYFISKSTVADLYDAAGSILVMMLWVYYSAAILLWGASFTFTRAEALPDRPEAAG
jgi:membrane protein